MQERHSFRFTISDFNVFKICQFEHSPLCAGIFVRVSRPAGCKRLRPQNRAKTDVKSRTQHRSKIQIPYEVHQILCDLTSCFTYRIQRKFLKYMGLTFTKKLFT